MKYIIDKKHHDTVCLYEKQSGRYITMFVKHYIGWANSDTMGLLNGCVATAKNKCFRTLEQAIKDWEENK